MSFGGIVAVANLSLTVEAGEILALAAPTAPARPRRFTSLPEYKPTAGRIIFDGQDITSYRPTDAVAAAWRVPSRSRNRSRN